MKICKKCGEVKFRWQFHKEVLYHLMKLTYRTKLCKDCAEEIKEEALLDYLKKNKLAGLH